MIAYPLGESHSSATMVDLAVKTYKLMGEGGDLEFQPDRIDPIQAL